MNNLSSQVEFWAPGTPVYSHSEIGYVCRVLEAKPGCYIIGADLRPVRHEYEIVFDRHVSQLGDGIIAPWIKRARDMGLQPISPDQVETRRAAAVQAQTAAREARQAEREAAEQRAAAFRIEAAARMPADAKAVIVAELHENDSDSMTDYHGHKVKRVLILAWSKHTRDLFPELRKAALNNPETAYLYDAPEKAEHREKYSMGHGFYLKSGFRDSSGWSVQKVRFYGDSRSVPVGEWSLPDATAAPVAAPSPAPVAAAAHGVQVEKHHHTKGGFDMWLAILPDRVDRAEYERLLGEAKALGGWYSRPWHKTPGGFAFKSEAAARTFAGAPAQPAAVQARPPSNLPGKLRDLADGMQRDIDGKFADRQTNTPKRQREAQSQRLDGYRLQRTQQGLRALADRHESGTVPPELAKVTSKAAAFELARGEIKSSGGYYDAGHETGRPASDTPEARAFWALLAPPSADARAAEALRQKLDNLRFANIPGFFPTPRAIVARMIKAADIPAGGRILEPSAGSGAILDEVRAAAPGCELVAFERHLSLRQILEAKGYELAGADFLEPAPMAIFDRVLMNPPFENGQDAEHVRRAFAHLKPGGRLVGIMSPSPFFRSDRKSAEFRAWFEAHGGTREELPANSFKESGTNVAAVMVTLDA